MVERVLKRHGIRRNAKLTRDLLDALEGCVAYERRRRRRAESDAVQWRERANVSDFQETWHLGYSAGEDKARMDYQKRIRSLEQRWERLKPVAQRLIMSLDWGKAYYAVRELAALVSAEDDDKRP